MEINKDVKEERGEEDKRDANGELDIQCSSTYEMICYSKSHEICNWLKDHRSSPTIN